MGDVLDAVRESCARVAERARFVRIEARRLRELARELAGTPAPEPGLDPVHHHVGGPDATLAYVVTLDALNFGSGWFPHLRKRPGLSGYFTVANSLRERFETRGPWSAAELARATPALCAEVLGQDRSVPEVAELMGLFAEALRQLGGWLTERHAGRFAGPVEEADGSAARLVQLLAEMPFYRDVARYRELTVPFFKRAQLTAADLAAAFHGRGPGAFRDLDRLTIFADNLVPHVLRREGVLRYEPGLARRIDAGELLEAGCEEEVEIRALAVHAVELCVAEIAAAGGPARGGPGSARELDQLLWRRGQRPDMKAHPRHRTRCTFY
jgi:hypothetical protein